MKKLFFSVLLVVVALAATEAQSLSPIRFRNSASESWSVKVYDANNLSEILNILPSTTNNLMNPSSWPSFTFPLQWHATNNATGHSYCGLISGYGFDIIQITPDKQFHYNLPTASGPSRSLLLRVINQSPPPTQISSSSSSKSN
jgi:hypothetical protein